MPKTPDQIVLSNTLPLDSEQVFLEAANEGTLYWDLKTDQMVWNDRQYEILGLRGKTRSLTFKHVLKRIHPDDRQAVLSTLEAARVKGGRFDLGYRLCRADTNDYGYYLLRGQYLYDAAGQATHLVALQKDDTLRWQAKQELESVLKVETFRRNLVELVSHTLELQEILDRTAKEVCEFFQADRCAVVRYDQLTGGKTAYHLQSVYLMRPGVPMIQEGDIPLYLLRVLECHNPETHSWIDKTRFSPPVLSPRYQMFLKNSILVPHAVLARWEEYYQLCPVCAQDFVAQAEGYLESLQKRSEMAQEIYYQGKLYGRIVVDASLADRRWTREESDVLASVAPQVGAAFYQADLYNNEQKAKLTAEIANRNKDQFLANVSHELRTPLNSILGYCQMLETFEKMTLSLRGQRYVHNIETSGQQLLTIINDMLDSSMALSHRIALSLEWVEVVPLMDNVLEVLAPFAELKQVKLNLSIQPGIYTIQADPVRLRQILVNLVNNAVKFNQPGGDVNILVEQDDSVDQVVFKIQDTGVGISQGQIPHLFDTFYQTEEVTTRQHSGIGLGLAIVKHLVDLHHGSIVVTSQPGEGSTFTFALPRG